MNEQADHPDIEKIAADSDGVIDGIPVRETIREIFRNPDNGTPDNISKAGCLALALKSNEVGRAAGEGKTHVLWNAWRAEFKVGWHYGKPVNQALFCNDDYRDVGIDFSDFVFGPRADFSRSIWGDGVRFCHAEWGEAAKFAGARWGAHADFECAQWGAHANFEDAEWEECANFKGAKWAAHARFQTARWGPLARFEGASWERDSSFHSSKWDHGCIFDDAEWGDGARFLGARWGDRAVFDAARWGDRAQFVGVQIGYAPRFIGAKWGWGANFIGLQCGDQADFLGAQWGDRADFSAASWPILRVIYTSVEGFREAQIWAEVRGLTPGSFQGISFKGACFSGAAAFTNRRFLGHTDFSASLERIVRDQEGRVIRDEAGDLRWEEDSGPLKPQFGKAPNFHGCELHQDTSFEGAVFPPDIGKAEGTEEAARAYRTLKLAFSKQQAIREEQRFFRLEMEEETLRETGLKRGLFRAYKWFSDYGFSVMRPFLLLLAAWLVFAPIYGHSSGKEVCWVWHTGCELRGDWFGYSLRQALPILGFDKPDHTTAHAMKGVAVGWLFLHKTISLTALFLIGLALRNLFKLK